MPRLTSAVPKYSKHRASGQAVVTLNGKDCYLGPHGTRASKIEYDRLIGEWLANHRTMPIEVEDESISVAELAVAYLKHARRYYVKNGKPTDELAGIKRAIKHLRSRYADLPVNEFGPVKLKAVRQMMIDAGNCRGYVNQGTGRIRRMFRWGVEEQLVPVDVHQALAAVTDLRAGKTEAIDHDPVEPVPDADIDAVLPHLKPVVADMVTGTDTSEASKLTSMRCAGSERWKCDGHSWRLTLASTYPFPSMLGCLKTSKLLVGPGNAVNRLG